MHLKYVAAGLTFCSAISLFFEPEREKTELTLQLTEDSLKQKEFIITGVGDIMLGTSFPSVSFLPPGDDPARLLGSLKDTLRNSDITTGNLEGSFLDNGDPYKHCRDTNLCYLFRMPERYAGALKEAGFDFLCLANNHFGDFGYPAASRTMSLLDSLRIKYAGPPECRYSLITKDSVKFGFCAFSTTAGSVNLSDTAGTDSIVRDLAGKCDIVIVSFHAGAEGSDYQHVTRTDEVFLGEDRGNVYEFAHRMIDCGADLVFGHGPHVTRAVEVYRDRFIAYSLGNFCTYGRFNITGPGGFAPLIRISVKRNGEFISGRIVPVCQGEDGLVKIDPAGRSVKKIIELVSEDFPDSGFSVNEKGEIFKN